jgi:hypothetical protein
MIASHRAGSRVSVANNSASSAAYVVALRFFERSSWWSFVRVVSSIDVGNANGGGLDGCSAVAG